MGKRREKGEKEDKVYAAPSALKHIDFKRFFLISLFFK